MKKIIIILLIFIVIFSSGCIEFFNPSEGESIPDPPEDNNEEKPDVIPPSSEPEIIVSNVDDYSSWYWIYGANSGYVAQTFVPPRAFVITEVEISLEIIGDVEDLQIEIQQTSADKPNTITVTSGILDKNLLETGWNKIDLVDAQLAGDTLYAIVIGMPDLENAGPVRIHANKPELYLLGESFYGNSFNLANWYPRIGEDYLFKIWGKW